MRERNVSILARKRQVYCVVRSGQRRHTDRQREDCRPSSRATWSRGKSLWWWQIEATLAVTAGQFSWDALPDGRWKIFVSSDGSKQDWEMIQFDSSSCNHQFSIPRPMSLTGVALTADSEPVTSAHLVARDEYGKLVSTQNDADGRSLFDRLDLGAYMVSSSIGS